MRTTVLTATLALGVGLHAAEKAAWFDQDYAGLTPATWSDTLGVWENTSNAVFVPGDSPHIEVSGGDEPLVFSPNGSTSTTNAQTAVFADVVFDGATDVEMLPQSGSGHQAGVSLAFGEADDGSLAFVGCTDKGWIELTATGVTPAADVPYRVGLEVKYDSAKTGSPQAVGSRVRYSVNGAVLRDAGGNEWFDGPANGPKRVTKIAFGGSSGRVGEFSAERGLRTPARAKINVPVVRATAGKSFSFADCVVTNEGAVLAGELTWKWYAGNWRGEYGETPISTAASVVPTATHYARWIKGEAHDDGGYVAEGRFWYSKLPVLYITTDDGKMPSSKKEEHDGWMKIQGNDEFKDSYDGKITVKVRGNSTSGYPKKPYKIKLDSKANLFGLGEAKNKHWVLLANYLDESLMRNKLAYDYAGKLGLVHLKSTWVDVVFNGQYAGVYQVCPHIRVAEDRVDIFDWEATGEAAADAIAAGVGMAKADKKALETQMSEDLAWVTSDSVSYKGVAYRVSTYYEDFDRLDIRGGYLFESSQEYDEVSKFKCLNRQGNKTNALAYVMLNKPEFLHTNPTMMDYCSNYWQRAVDAWCGVKGRNARGEHWSELCNVPSMAGFWWVNASLLNNDASYKSRYCYLPHDGKLTFGPAWDFDWGVGSVPVRQKVVDPVTGKTSWKEPGYTGWGPGTNGRAECWMRQWCADPLFLKSVYRLYVDTLAYYRSFFATDGLIDGYAAYLNESARANEDAWPYAIGWSGESGDVASLKRFLSNRSGWLDARMATYESFTNSVGSAKNAANYYLGDVPAPVPTSLDGKVTQAELESWMNVNYPEVTNLYGVAFAAQYQELVDKVDAKGCSPTGKPQPLARDFIAGTDPKDPDSVFKIVNVELKDGELRVQWDPDLNEAGTKAVRDYSVLGKESLDPSEPWGPKTKDSRFFKVEVKLP